MISHEGEDGVGGHDDKKKKYCLVWAAVNMHDNEGGI